MVQSNISDETILEFGAAPQTLFTVAIPTYRDSPERLIEALSECKNSDQVCLIVYDDGSQDRVLTQEITEALRNRAGLSVLITGRENLGRAHARNRLIAHSTTAWILFLDADMVPDSPDFLKNYQSHIKISGGPALIAGGFSLQQVVPSNAQKLHAAQSLLSECLPAEIRASEPGRYVFTSNIMAHRHVLETIAFDDGFTGWGWEDTDWGLRVARSFPVIHIDNSATHLGLDDTETLISKYGTSGRNFARMVARNPEDADKMALTRAARKLAKLPGRSLVKTMSKLTAQSPLPSPLRLKALKLYRAAAYAEHLE